MEEVSMQLEMYKKAHVDPDSYKIKFKAEIKSY